MSENPAPVSPSTPHKRRPRYSGKNPRRFNQKYKEHEPQRYADTVAKVVASGKTPAGTHRPIMVAEILDGELLLFPRPARPHAAACSALGEELGPPFKRGRGGPGGWIILTEPEFHFGENILIPDLAGWRRERMPVITTGISAPESGPANGDRSTRRSNDVHRVHAER